MPKLLITGSNGLLGQKLLSALKYQSDFSVIATSGHAERSKLGYFPFELLDITQKEAVAACIAKYLPDILIHTAAMTNVDPCELNKERCWEINVNGTENLVHECEKTGTHFIHLSTDFVFDGEKGPYREEDLPRPLNAYGLSKLESEKIVRQSKLPWTIIRTALVYGAVSDPVRSNILLFVKNNLEQKKPIREVEDQVRTPTLAEDLAWACLETAKRKATGIFHISGSEAMSIYELALLIAEIFGLDRNLIQPVSTEALRESARRPRRTGFILDKARNLLGYQPHSLQGGLTLVRQQMTQK